MFVLCEVCAWRGRRVSGGGVRQRNRCADESTEGKSCDGEADVEEMWKLFSKLWERISVRQGGRQGIHRVQVSPPLPPCSPNVPATASCLRHNSIASINNLPCKGVAGTTFPGCGTHIKKHTRTHTHSVSLSWQLLPVSRRFLRLCGLLVRL